MVICCASLWIHGTHLIAHILHDFFSNSEEIVWLQGANESNHEGYIITVTSRDRQSISNHRRLHCLLNHLFRHKSEKTSKLCTTGPLWGEFTADRWILLTKGQQHGKRLYLMMSSWQDHRHLTAIKYNNPHTVCILRWRNIYIYSRQCMIVYEMWCRHNDITWVAWSLKPAATRFFVQRFVRTNIKANIKSRHQFPFVRESIGDRCISLIKGQ